MAKVYFIIITFLFFQRILFSQNQNPSINSGRGLKFEHISTKDGLVCTEVNTILQDRHGFMWFGTRTGGMVKYDGYKFTVYKNIPGDSTSLSGNDVYVLYEDRSGRLWAGTWNSGLCCFNRNTNSFIRYKRQKNDSTSLSANRILSLFESKSKKQNIFWVGTSTGLNRYQQKTDNFRHYYPDVNKEKTKQNDNFIYAIVQDSTGRIWIGTWNEGLFYYEPKSNLFKRFEAKKEYFKLFKNKNPMTLCTTREGNKNIIWMGTYINGLYKIDVEHGQIKNFLPDPDYPGNGFKNTVYTMQPANNTNGRILWVGTRDNGLCRFDSESQKLVHFRHESGNPASLSSNSIKTLMEDKNGILWIGVNDGINKVNPLKSNFTPFNPTVAIQNGQKIEEVTSFCESESAGQKMIWIGTNGGLYKYNRGTRMFTHFKHEPKNVNSLTSDYIHSLLISQNSDHNYIWAGTLNGINRINPDNEHITRFYVPNNDPLHNYIESLYEDEAGFIWITTQSGGLYKFNPKDKSFTNPPPYKTGDFLFIDSSGNLWIGGRRGVIKYHFETEKNTYYQHKQEDLNSISNNDIITIFEDNNKNIWIGTAGGLNKYIRNTETFISYKEKDGLPSDVINGIQEDELGNLWLSTDRGISKFDPVNKTFRNFDSGDGLHGDFFFRNSAYKSKSGEMFFGGPKGFTMFHPEKIKENEHIPPIIISDFQIFNKSVQPGKNSILKKQISDIWEIFLPYDLSVFSFEFSALDYFNPQKNLYAYKMEGIDPQWVHTDASRRFATYTNLDPGSYTFRVKGSNNHGYWNEEGISIKVVILPPWWRTNVAYSAYILIFGFTLFALRTYDRKRQHLKQELEMEHFETDKLREVDHMKSRFFANISHEFRTPLTLIKGPVKQIMDGEFTGNLKQQCKMILRNSDRLLGLINQILDLSKIESGGMKLKVSKIEIIQFLKGLAFSFSSLAERKNIKLKFNTELKTINGYIDQDKLEKIVTNLLSNAFKFTPEEGVVEVFITPLPLASPLSKGGTREVKIKISNTGSGIAPEQIDKIFDRFYQMENNYKKEPASLDKKNHGLQTTNSQKYPTGEQGTGIGLALTKELVEVCQGTISVSSIPDKSTSFKVILPIDKGFFKEDEIIEEAETADRIPEAEEQILTPDENIFIPSKSSKRSPVSTLQYPLILIVEDNPDVTSYISSFLDNDFRLITAENGKIGLEKALDKFPDLIISDVMMPEMDGFELCNKIKSDERISHIPLILLTAKADLNSKIEGLEFGADDYLSKPFDSKELQVRVKNLIEQRRKLCEKFARESGLRIDKIAQTSADKKFAQQVLDIISENISDFSFNIESLAEKVGMSRMHLHRKIQGLFGLSPGEFLRTIRMKRSAELLKMKTGNISEIAYEVGYESPAYFSNCFRQQFGISPSNYIKNSLHD